MKRGFTLAEVMITLLLIVILMAAALPILTKSLTRTPGASANTPWEWVGNTPNAKFNSAGSNIVAMIGLSSAPTGNLPSLLINTGSNDTNHIDFYQGGEKKGALAVDGRGVLVGHFIGPAGLANLGNAVVIGYSNSAYHKDSIAIGYDIYSSGNNGIHVGSNISSGSSNCALGIGSKAHSSLYSIALGANARTGAENSIAIGSNSKATLDYTTSLGYNSVAGNSIFNNRFGITSLVIGNNSKNIANNSILIAHGLNLTSTNYTDVSSGGSNSNASYENSIILGNDSMPVVLLGNVAAINGIRANNLSSNSISCNTAIIVKTVSDARLKNIGEEFTSGMDKLNQLKVYNYTFKNSPERKRVGIIAQQLMKIFPDAVSKDENGYYTIRQEDIFYAMVNALKDFDKKIKGLAANITTLNKNITDL